MSEIDKFHSSRPSTLHKSYLLPCLCESPLRTAPAVQQAMKKARSVTRTPAQSSKTSRPNAQLTVQQPRRRHERVDKFEQGITAKCSTNGPTTKNKARSVSPVTNTPAQSSKASRPRRLNNQDNARSVSNTPSNNVAKSEVLDQWPNKKGEPAISVKHPVEQVKTAASARLTTQQPRRTRDQWQKHHRTRHHSCKSSKVD